LSLVIQSTQNFWLTYANVCAGSKGNEVFFFTIKQVHLVTTDHSNNFNVYV
jgi:hypothetical protein